MQKKKTQRKQSYDADTSIYDLIINSRDKSVMQSEAIACSQQSDSDFLWIRRQPSSPETTLLLEIKLLLKYKLEREDKTTTQNKNAHISLGVSNDNVFGWAIPLRTMSH